MLCDKYQEDFVQKGAAGCKRTAPVTSMNVIKNMQLNVARLDEATKLNNLKF